MNDDVDVFADIDFEATDVRADQYAKETKSFMRVIEKLTPLADEDMILETCKQLTDMIQETPEHLYTLMTSHAG